MKVVLIEDESPSAEKLQRVLLKYNPEIEIKGVLSSVDEACEWLEFNQDLIDLVFMDIQLSDRLCFEIFDQVNLTKPVIFTTAFDEYAIDAFKVNSIDYIVKPVTITGLSRAMKKMDTLREELSEKVDYSKIARSLSGKRYKDRFIVKRGNHLLSIRTEEIVLFYADGRTLYLLNRQNGKFIIDFNLQNLEGLLNPELFYRLNRKYIVNINCISDVILYSNSRLKVLLDFDFNDEIIVSRERVADFKTWFGGGDTNPSNR